MGVDFFGWKIFGEVRADVVHLLCGWRLSILRGWEGIFFGGEEVAVDGIKS